LRGVLDGDGDGSTGQALDALTWGKDIAAIVKRDRKGHGRLQSVRRAVTEVAWISQWDTVARADEAFVKPLADREYLAALGKGGQMLVAGSAHDHIWKHF
jgi:hypothetical protein